MATAKLSYVNHVDRDGALASASVTSGSMAPPAIFDTRPLKRWRSTTLNVWLQIDFGADVDIDVIALVFPRDTAFPSGTVQFLLDANGGTPGAGAAYDSGSVTLDIEPGYGYQVQQPSATVTARYLRIQFNATGVSRLDVGRVWAGELFEPERNIDTGYVDRWLDASAKTRGERSGSTFVDELDRFREISFAFSTVSQSDRAVHRELQRLVGISKQVLLLVDPDTPKTETVLGRLEELSGVRYRANAFQLYEATYLVREY